MALIIPAIIPTSREHLSSTLDIVAPFTHDVQVDIVDGVFVPFTSWPYGEGETVKDIAPFTDAFVVEVDLMVQEPETVIQSYAKAGVRRIVVHLESVGHLKTIIALKDTYAIELGFSIANDTDLRALTSVIDYADYVQLMGIAHIGSQGQPFDTRVLERIKELKELYPALQISIDGSVNEETLPRLIEAGADRFVVGSAVLSATDPHSAYNKLASL